MNQTNPHSGLEFRSIVDDELKDYCLAFYRGFGAAREPDDDDVERIRAIQDVDRTVVAIDDGEIVGTLGDFALLLTMPGGHQEAMAGTTEVTVRSTHRRRGILREMMRRHLQMAADRGEALAGLWASEPGIYGRFGFGLAADRHHVEFDSRLVDLAAPADDIELRDVPPDRLIDIVAPCWSAMARQVDRPGFIDRGEPRWRDLMDDPESHREGQTATRHIVAIRGGQVVGYLAYRQRDSWEQLPQGLVSIRALAAVDEPARAALWHHAAHIDLFPKVEFWDAAVDDPVAEQSSNPSAIRRLVADGLYLRILDVERSLQARTYEVDDRLVLDVHDEAGYADGTIECSVVDGRATVTGVSSPPDVRLGVRELSALLIGRDCAPMLAGTGRIDADAAVVGRLSRLFRTGVAPWCPEMF